MIIPSKFLLDEIDLNGFKYQTAKKFNDLIQCIIDQQEEIKKLQSKLNKILPYVNTTRIDEGG